MISPIVVCTYPRSGSSLTCGLLHEAGIWVGECREVNHFNPKGFFENRDLMGLCRPKKVVRWADVRPALERQRWKGERWLVKIKAPLWRCWLPLCPTFIKVRRSPGAIMASRMAKKLRNPDEVRRELDVMTGMMENEIPGHTVWPERLVAGDDSGFRAVWADLGLEWSCRFLDRSLWHYPGTG